MSLSVQFLSLLAMIGTGIVAAAFHGYDWNRDRACWKKVDYTKACGLARSNWLDNCRMLDILYSLSCRDGAWRIYDPFAQLSGMLLYVSYFHKPFRFFGRIVLTVLLKPLWFIVHLIVTIIRQVIRFVLKIIALLVRPFVKIYRKYFVNPFNKKGD